LQLDEHAVFAPVGLLHRGGKVDAVHAHQRLSVADASGLALRDLMRLRGEVEYLHTEQTRDEPTRDLKVLHEMLEDAVVNGIGDAHGTSWRSQQGLGLAQSSGPS
jgi:hypothetical protein